MPNLFRRSRDRGSRQVPMVAWNSPAGGIPTCRDYSRFALFHHQRDNVKIDKPILRIEDFHVVADRAAAASQRFPIKTANAFIEPLAGCFACLQPKYSTCCIVEVSDPGFRIRHDDAFLDGIEHGFQETFLLRQAQKIILHVFRTDAAEALDEFFKKARFHKLTLRLNPRIVETLQRISCAALAVQRLNTSTSSRRAGTSTVSISTRK